jgi:hypothetical protein
MICGSVKVVVAMFGSLYVMVNKQIVYFQNRGGVKEKPCQCQKKRKPEK